MDFINKIIIIIDEAGLRSNLYSVINTVALCISLSVGLLNGLKLKAGFWPSFISVATEYFLSGAIVSAIIYIEDGFRISGRQNGMLILPYIPLIGYLVSKVVRKSYKEIWDTIIVIPIAMFVGARIACTVTGCCRGYPCEWGVYNAITGEKLFPIQLLEALISILILVHVFLREKRNGFIPDGMNVPIVLISYGTLRFLCEFLHDDAKIFVFNWMQVHCVIMVLVGLIAFNILKKSEILRTKPF